MTWRKWPGANFSPGPWRDVSGHGSSVQPNEFNFIHILLFVFHIITFFVGLQDTKSTAAVVKLFIKFLSCLLFYSLAFNKIIFFLCSAYQIKSAIKRFSCKSATHFLWVNRNGGHFTNNYVISCLQMMGNKTKWAWLSLWGLWQCFWMHVRLNSVAVLCNAIKS